MLDPTQLQLAGNSPNIGEGPSSSAAIGSNKLGKNEFLKMLLTQMQNQDPTSPMDNQQMVAQLATFSTLEQQEQMNSKLDNLLLAQTANNQTSVASLVGQTVAYRSNKIHFDGLQGTIHANLAENAATVTAVIS